MSASSIPRPGYSPGWFASDCAESRPLLVGQCASAEYTLVDGGPTAYYAPFIGCHNNRQGCCPFKPISTEHAVVTAAVPQRAYPHPLDAQDATLDACPLDYYSISGSCCPRYVRVPWLAQFSNPRPIARTPLGLGLWAAKPRASAPSLPRQHRRPLQEARERRLRLGLPRS